MQSTDSTAGATSPPRLDTRPKKSFKEKKSKSRTGCRNCKERRLKCDEIRPACLHCVRRGWRCPGYKQELRWSTKYEKFLGQEPDAVSNNAHNNSEQQLLANAELEAKRLQFSHSSNFPHVSNGRPETAHTWTAGDTDRNQVEIAQTALSPQLSGVSMDDLAPINDISSENGLDQLFHTDADLDWLLNDATEVNDSFEVEQRGFNNNTSLIVPRKISSTSSNHGAHRRHEGCSIPYDPVDVSTLLVEYWFTNVCPMWSAYDSASNPNRQIALSTWQNSEPVVLSLQSMSAAYLIDSLPHLRPELMKTSSQAMEAIHRHLSQHSQSGQKVRAALPVDILFAIFAMGTSLCWTVTCELGTTLLSVARRLISSYERQSEKLSSSDRKYLSHFRNALIYWEMLHNVVSPNSYRDGATSSEGQGLIEATGNNSLTPLHPISPTREDMPVLEKDAKPDLHPWTGISHQVQEQFSLILALCRTHQQRGKNSGPQTAAQLYDSIRDIELAQVLEVELLALDFGVKDSAGTSDNSSLDTGDSTTPIAHLVDVAEAYRLASLLQLYQTFPDLRVKTALINFAGRLTNVSFVDGLYSDQRGQGILAITFQLLDLLQRIPIESGTRCIQPILYVVAATGLRFDIPVSQPAVPKPSDGLDAFDEVLALMDAENTASDQQTTMKDVSFQQLGKEHGFSDELGQREPTRPSLTQCTLKVARSRQFIMDRLQKMQTCLPPRPIRIALNLTKAIWAEYDYSPVPLVRGNWTDVMLNNSLWTLFG